MKSNPLGILTVVLAILLAGCTGPVANHGGPTSAAPVTPNGSVIKLPFSSFELVEMTNGVPASWLKPSTNLFTLGPGDTIEVENLSESASGATAKLGPDGKIYYSFLPGLFVWGLTLDETRLLIEKEMAGFLKTKPELGITLRAVGSRYIWVLGTVQTPGVYPLSTPTTILEAISLAGGTLTPPGVNSGVLDLARSFIMRHGRMIQVDLHALLARGDMSQNIYLEPDDFVYLHSSLTRNVYLTGAVAQPSIIPYQDDLTLLGAIAQGGGTIPYAQRGKVIIVRGSLTKPVVTEVDYGSIAKGKAPDVLLEPGDIIHMPLSPYARLGQLAEQVVRDFVRTTAVNEGYRAAGGTGNVVPTVAAP